MFPLSEQTLTDFQVVEVGEFEAAVGLKVFEGVVGQDQPLERQEGAFLKGKLADEVVG